MANGRFGISRSPLSGLSRGIERGFRKVHTWPDGWMNPIVEDVT